MIGDTISHFEILELIGKGGFGEVYRARDTELDRPVALKMLPEAFSEDPSRRTRFRREARAASRLNHPNVCTIYEFGEKDGRAFIAMELVEGQTLRERISESPLGPAEVVEVAIQIAEGLAAAHREGVVHRDIKSSNIVLTDQGRVKILDFGLAKWTYQDAVVTADTPTLAPDITPEGTALGTVDYMSPEQLLGRDVDSRTDQFAFGAVCYELLSGRLPFLGATVFETSNAILHHEPPVLFSVAPGVPAELGQIVHRMLAKDPENRFASAEELVTALKEARSRLARGEFASTPGIPPGSSLEGLVSGRVIARSADPSLPSIAVLPLANLSGVPENDYFSDGLSEDLTNALAHISGLSVASRTSAFFFKEKKMDIRQIASTLGVQTVLEGSVRMAGDRIRVTAQLINAADGYHIWSESYDRDLEDVFAIQDDISRTIAETLQVKLLGPPDQPLVRRCTEDMDAYKFYLQGRYHWNRRYGGGMQAAIGFFQQAMEKDPTFALPYSGLADSLGILAFYNYLPPNETFPKAKASAEAALRIDDTIAEAHSSLGFIKTFYDWDWEGGNQEFVTALELETDYATGRWWYASALMVRGLPEDSDRELQRALEAEPLSAIISGGASFHFYFRRQYEKALEQARRAQKIDPAFGPSHAFQAWCHLELGDFENAVEEWQRATELMEGLPLVRAMLGITYARSGEEGQAREILATLVDQSASAWISPYHVAGLCTAVGDIDDAFDWLELAFEGRNNWLPFLRIDPIIDPLRGDPRLDDLIERVGLSAS